MNSNQKFTENPEFDDFFRRGEESTHGADSIQPVVGSAYVEEEPPDEFVRTPAQMQRRAKFIKIVSITMACLTVGSIGAFAHQASANRARHIAANVALQPPVGPDLQRTELAGTRAAGSEMGLSASSGIEPSVAQAASAAQEAAKASPVAKPASAPAVIAAAISPSATATATSLRPNSAPDSSAHASSDATQLRTATLRTTKAEPSVLRGRKVSVASKSVTSVAHVQTSSSKACNSKAVGPKPEGYRPPTASFSD